MTSWLAGAAVTVFLVTLAAVNGAPFLGVLLIVLLAFVFVPVGMWVSDVIWGKAED